MTNVTFTAFGTEHTLRLYSSVLPSPHDDAKLFARHYATCYRNTFGALNWRYYETLSDAEAARAEHMASSLNKVIGEDYAPDIVIVEGAIG